MRPLGPGREVVPGVRVLGHLHRSNRLDVYDAWCERRAARVVLKTLRPDRAGDARAARALLREGRLLRRLGHPNLLRAYEVHAAPRPAVVLETLGGETLQRLAARRRPAASEIAVVGVQLGGALRYLHAEGVLHLDVKPSNAIADGAAAKLIDLSIARPPGRVRAGCGTWCNMAPEQARGGAVGAAADSWGLGTVLYELAAGEGPFADDDGHEFPQLHRRADPVRRVRRLPPALGDAIDACLEPDPAQRPGLDDLVGTLVQLAI
jgi:eukaryotic-like serine/threonine-protein kinase